MKAEKGSVKEFLKNEDCLKKKLYSHFTLSDVTGISSTVKNFTLYILSATYFDIPFNPTFKIIISYIFGNYCPVDISTQIL